MSSQDIGYILSELRRVVSSIHSFTRKYSVIRSYYLTARSSGSCSLEPDALTVFSLYRKVVGIGPHYSWSTLCVRPLMPAYMLSNDSLTAVSRTRCRPQINLRCIRDALKVFRIPIRPLPVS